MSTIRAFIAAEMPAAIRTALKDTARTLKEDLSLGSVRWVKPENIHLTLRFLGNVEQNDLQQLYQALDNSVSLSRPFALHLDEIGCFPKPRRPRVIWVGLGGDVHHLASLYQSIEEMLIPLGWEKETRKYHAHLTLGRVKNSRQVISADLPWGKRIAEGRFDVEAVHLIESQLYPSGAVYTIRHSSILSRQDASLGQ
jgi:2'-5' RNA ligase